MMEFPRAALSCISGAPMSVTPLLIALPHLHPELVREDARTLGLSLPEETLVLWPGLPGMPEHAHAPALPWSPAQAAACLADFERTIRDGAHGLAVTPLAAGGLSSSGGDLSPAEQDALARLKDGGTPSIRPDAPSVIRLKRENAQRTLLLAWLQEQQNIELKELARSVTRKQADLAALLGDGLAPPRSASPEEPVLPPPAAWRAVLEAAATLLDRETREGSLRFLVLDRDMADTLTSIPPARILPPPEGVQPPAPFPVLRLHLSAIPGLSSGSAGGTPDDPVLTFLCPVLP